MKRKVLVTGSAGFIGSNFVRRFREKEKDFDVVGIDLKENIAREDFFYRGSVGDVKLMKKIFEEHHPEYVFHFAAFPRVTYSVLCLSETTHNNICGLTTVIEFCRDYKVKRLIFSSSSSIYGGAKSLPTKESDNFPDPKSPYAAHKYAGEIFCRQASELYGLDTVSLRYFNVYGPGQYGSDPYSTVVSAWLEAQFFGDTRPYLEGDGKQSRDFSYVEDVVDANIAVMERSEDFRGEAFNIGAGSRTDLLTVKELIEKHTGEKLDLEQRKPRLGDVMDTQADISKAKEWFGFVPKVSFEEGLIKTIDWFKSRSK